MQFFGVIFSIVLVRAKFKKDGFYYYFVKENN